MDNPTLTTVIPVRNRSGVRLENCLRSLRWQDVEPATHEIVLSDFGSDDTHRRSIDRLSSAYGVRVVRTDTEEVWNRSRALNIGVQAGRGAYVFCTDADMIFQPNFVSSLLEVHSGEGCDHMIHCRCHDLPESAGEQVWQQQDFEGLRAKGVVRAVMGTGACQSAPTAYFHAVRGYDEKYRYWGAEDVDMTARARRYGLKVVWVSNRTSMLHQWHETMKNDRKLLWRINRWRYRLTKHIVVKNRRGWGSAE